MDFSKTRRSCNQIIFQTAAVTIILRAITCDAIWAADSSAGHTYFVRAEQALNKGREVDAYELINKAIKCNDQRAEFFVLRARIYLDSRNSEEAIADCNRAIGLDRSSAPAYFWRARSNEINGACQAAREDIARANALHFDRPDLTRKELVAIARREKDSRKATETAPIAEALKNLLDRGEQLEHRQDLDGALKVFKQAAARYPESNLGHYHYASILIKQGDIDQAIDEYTAAIKLCEPSTIHFYRGRAYLAKGKYSEAIKDFERCCQLNLDKEQSMASMMQCYLLQKKYTDAIAIGDKLIAMQPIHAEHYAARAESYKKLGRYKEAAADLTVAIRLDPVLPSFVTERADIYEKMGQHDLAQKDRALASHLSGKLEDDLFPSSK